VYTTCSPAFNARCTAPLLADKLQRRIVCNDSGILLDSLYSVARKLGISSIDLKPPDMAAEIDELNDMIYNTVNNAAYRCAALPDVQWPGRAMGGCAWGLRIWQVCSGACAAPSAVIIRIVVRTARDDRVSLKLL
jgi:hypothetical protein